MTKSIGTKREVTEIKTMYFNRRVNVPGILIEAGFLSNGSDRAKLVKESYQEEFTDKIVTGVIQYFIT